LLSGANSYDFNTGDGLELLGAFLWAVQILLIAKLAPYFNAFSLSFMQFLSCALFSLIGALIYEPFVVSHIQSALIPLLYTGIMSTGVAFTLQVIAQQNTSATYAAIIMSLEAVFAALTGWCILGETMSATAIIGCIIMLTGILVAQINIFKWFQSKRQVI